MTCKYCNKETDNTSGICDECSGKKELNMIEEKELSIIVKNKDKVIIISLPKEKDKREKIFKTLKGIEYMVVGGNKEEVFNVAKKSGLIKQSDDGTTQQGDEEIVITQ